MSVTRQTYLFGIIALFACLVLPARAAQDAEYDLKAAFLIKILPFITFPDGTHLDAAHPPAIAIVGKDPFGSRLERALSSAYPKLAPRVRRFPSVRQLRKSKDTFEVAFVTLPDERQRREALGWLAAQQTLTVGDSEKFCRQGGMVSLLNEKNRIQFEINRQVAEQANLKISSKLLALARIVESDQL